jgi:hypothetical protein
MPHFVPISPQWRMNFCWICERIKVASLITVKTEYTVNGECARDFLIYFEKSFGGRGKAQ